jgi:hypothetical protein
MLHTNNEEFRGSVLQLLQVKLQRMADEVGK